MEARQRRYQSTRIQEGIAFINQEIQSLRDKINLVYDREVVAEIEESINILKEMKKEYFKRFNQI